MDTEFEVSSRLVFWGDALEPERICHLMAIDPSHCEMIKKGEPVLLNDGSSSGSFAKTGRWMYRCDDEYPEWRRDPDRQLGRMEDALRRVPTPFSDVESAQLQLKIRYRNAVRGEPSFVLSPTLVSALSLHKISLRIAALP